MRIGVPKEIKTLEFRVGATNRFHLDALITALVKLKRSDGVTAAKRPRPARRQK